MSKPILFRADMVRAILAGNKTQTRRLIAPTRHMKSYAASIGGLTPLELNEAAHTSYIASMHQGWTSKFDAGEQLYVKETWAVHAMLNKKKPSELSYDTPVVYRADQDVNESHYVWRSSLFMPRWASRITLNILNVRSERLNSITDADAVAEGVANAGEYQTLWNRINAGTPYTWNSNPWVYVIEFFAYAHTKVASK